MKIERLIYENERGEVIDFSSRSIFFTDSVTGLNDIRNEIYSFSSMGQDGESYIGNRIKSRDIDITGRIRATGKDEQLRCKRLLNHIINPHLSATLTYIYGDYVRVIDCKVENSPTFSHKPIFTEFNISFVCLDPFWRNKHESRDDIASWIGAFEFELEILEGGIELGYREPSLIVNVCNSGDVKTGMRIDFRATGTVSNPRLLNVDTLEFIAFNNLTLTTGDVLSVSTYYGKKDVALIRNGVKYNAFKYLDVDSTYLQLELGDNLLRYEAQTNQDALEVSIYHNDRFLGV